MIKGGCHCGAVQYESHGKVLLFLNCHCPNCRKFTNSDYASIVVTESDGFQLTTGDGNLVPYESSPGKERCFCKTCGCHVFSRAEQRPGMIFIRAGTIDGDPQVRPECHVWVSAKAPWHEICDDLPQYPEGLPQK